MKIITIDDFIDIYNKVYQRGLGFILSKLNPNRSSRTKSAFDDSAFHSSNWWIIPKVKQRWNEKITGDKTKIYEHYIIEKYLNNSTDIRMLSIGSGVCSHELVFAQSSRFSKITCVDIVENLLKKAKENSEKLGLHNIEFLTADIRKTSFDKDSCDIVLFHSSLHHFPNIEHLLMQQVAQWLKPNGLIIIHEYVGKNRLQFDRNQIVHINKGLSMVPEKYKRRFKTEMIKKKFYGSGIVRMIMADPSECIESENIIPVLHANFNILEEKSLGGNLLMNILKDISHNFVDTNERESQKILHDLFLLEDQYLKKNNSDFIFGVYQKP